MGHLDHPGTVEGGRRHVIVSPHTDDAVLSCGALLLTQGSSTRVVTVYAGIPPADVPASDWDKRCGFTHARDAAVVRQAEDLRACASVAAEAVHLGWYDISYGRQVTHDELVQALLPMFDGSAVWLPAGIGGHPDHLMARDAGLEAARLLGLSPRLYADTPYAGDTAHAATEAERDARSRWRPPLDGAAAAAFTLSAPRSRHLSPTETAAKITLARHYASQLSSLGALYPRLMHIEGDLVTETWWQAHPVDTPVTAEM